LNDAPLSAQFIALGILLLVAGFFSIAETSMMALNRYRLKAMVRLGSRGAKIATELLARIDRLLGMILLCNTLFNAAATVIASVIAVQLLGNDEVALAIGTVAVTFLILVFAEITPKVIGANYADTIAPLAAFVLKPLLTMLYPVTWFVNVFVQAVLRLLRLKSAAAQESRLTPEELRTLVLEAGHYIPKKHQSILLNLFELESIVVDDVMTPRSQIETINLDAPPEELREQITTAHHRRLAVYEKELDNIVGVVLVRRLLANSEAIATAQVRELMREPYFVPTGTPLLTQLQEFQEHQDRVCFVVDEYGELLGMVTVEDIVEELVGEFATQSPLQTTRFERQPDGSYLIEGSSLLRTLNRKLGCRFPLDGPKTLNGLILEHLQDIPEPGVSLKIADHALEIVQTQDRVVKSVRLFPPPSRTGTST